MRSLLALLEPEEFVGGLWHDLTSRTARTPHFPQASVTLESMQRPLTVLFRGLGGAPALRIAAVGATIQGNRRTLREIIAGRAGVAVARRDGQALYLPPQIDAWPDQADNRALYVWLAAFFAHRPARPVGPADVMRDIGLLHDVRTTTRQTLAAAPGLATVHAGLCAIVLQARLRRRLPPAEAAIESAIRALLGDQNGFGFEEACARAATASAGGYQTFAPVPLWGEARIDAAGNAPAIGEENSESAASDGDQRTRKGRRSEQEQTERRDYLALNRFEKLLTMAQSMNLARPVEDDDEDGARRATEDPGEIVLSPHRKTAATRLKLELDLSPADAVDGAAEPGLRYPEWDWRRRSYRPEYCRVLATTPPGGDQPWRPSEDSLKRIRRVRRQFEALRPRHETMRAQLDGDDLDLEALVRSRADFLAGNTPSDRIYLATRQQSRDLAVALLVDASLSTESWVANQRVIDIASESALLFCHALDAGGDSHAVFSFTSRGRNDVRVHGIKDFSEGLSAAVVGRIGALKPGQYTRIGAALRHVTAQLAKQPARHRLLLVLTDGKPNDIDHYEGRFGVEDTRRAIQEARRGGARVFGITIDARAQNFFPALFGRGGYAIVSDPARLPLSMPLLLRHMMTG
jgi:nitric oxide reductase NorD protein